MDNKKNANNIKYKIDIFRVLGCIVIYGIFGVLSFSYMRSYLALVFITVFAILPVYSVACLIVLSKNVLIEFINREDCIEINQSIGIVIHVTNKSFFSSLRCLCKLNLYNDYYSLEAQQNYNIPVSAKADDVHTLVCTAQYLGKIRVELSEAVLHDFFGIFKAYITCHDEMNVIVMPSFETIDDNTRAGLLEGCIDNTDENIKGTDYSDTFNIREYIPGDRIKDIHWKLSAKKDELLVKERIKSSESQLVLWIDSAGSRKICEEIMSLTGAVVDSFLNEGVFIRVMWFNFKINEVDDFYISNRNQIYTLFEKMYEGGHGISLYDATEMITDGTGKPLNFVKIGFEDGVVKAFLYETK